ncbi:DUF5320 family protein [Sporolituus thermophilus]|uniref:DUF5320 domain-containing protein n=1 Tax=Sporolituus thermophilus DSM 23256 TaxID=1123285 RepID=A0A1G7NWT7_9FIRM|nr:DUF5320 family protein [Sporolituus thermophilus]SDF78357.1 hypothetical protein SAMN05660235_02743 [Sporolituus thermophilus DSM 23256]
MPGSDGTGPFGTGPLGRGLGGCLGAITAFGRGIGRGLGFGRGMGRGCGMGLGGCRGMGRVAASTQGASAMMSAEQLQMMADQLEKRAAYLRSLTNKSTQETAEENK